MPWIVTRFVGAPNVRDAAKLFGSPRDLGFVKAVLREVGFYARDETIDVEHFRHETVMCIWLSGRN